VSEVDALRARIAQLGSRGAARVDPARYAHLQALTARLASQRDDVRAVLQARVCAAIDALGARLPQAAQDLAPVALPEVMPRRARVPTPAKQPVRQPSLPRTSDAPDGAGELASVIRFRRAWNSGRAQERVAAAAARMPYNAGPLNSHMLVLQSLEMMRGLPGDYLRRFLTHVESLQWLETAQAQAASAGRKPAREKARAKTKAKRGS